MDFGLFLLYLCISMIVNALCRANSLHDPLNEI